MDLSKVSAGSKVILGLGVLMLLDSFLHWQEVSYGPISAGVSMWHGIGVLIGLLLLALLAWEGAQVAGIKVALGPLSPAMVSLGLAALLALFTLIKVLANSYVATWAWIGLLLALGILAGAWWSMKAAGESLSDLTTSSTSSATEAPAAAPAPDAPTTTPEAGLAEADSSSGEAPA